MKRIVSLLLACVFVLAIAGCSAVKDKISDAIGGGSGTSSGSSSSSTSKDAEVEKHNAYIDLYNTLIDDVDEVVYDYVDEFGSEDEVYIEDGFSGFSLYSNSLASALDKALPYADKAPSEPDADSTLKALAPDLKLYADTLTAAKKYYGDKNYVDDNFAKSQEYHTIIIGNYSALWDKIDAFMDAVDVMLEGQDEEQLAQYQANGEMIHFYALTALIAAEEFNSYLKSHDITAENVLDADINELRPIYDRLAAAYSEYDKLVGDDSNAGKDEGIMTLSMFTKYLKDVKSGTAELIDRLQNGKVFDASELLLAHLNSGTPEYIDEKVGELLSAYNTWVVRS
jgi:hypothetical protein